MRIENNHLFNEEGLPVRFVPTPNMGGPIVKPLFLVLHFTGGVSMAGVEAWFTNRKSQVSAHLCIGRDGSVVQFVPFDRQAWHAGASKFEGYVGLNKYSIGIELDNAGVLRYRSGNWYLGSHRIPADQVITAKHKLEPRITRAWQTYTPVQIGVLTAITRALLAEYPTLAVVGHEDIATSGKVDPGPAFPWEAFREAIK